MDILKIINHFKFDPVKLTSKFHVANSRINSEKAENVKGMPTAEPRLQIQKAKGKVSMKHHTCK